MLATTHKENGTMNSIAAQILGTILFCAILSGCAGDKGAAAAPHVEARSAVYCMVQGKRQRELVNDLTAMIDKQVPPGTVKITVIEVGEGSGIIEPRSNVTETRVLSQCCRPINGNRFFLSLTPHFAVCDKFGNLKLETGTLAAMAAQAVTLANLDASQSAANVTRQAHREPAPASKIAIKQDGQKADKKIADSDSARNATRPKVTVYPKPTMQQMIERDEMNQKSDEEAVAGDKCFAKNDYPGAESHYLRSIALSEAWCRRFYGPEPGAPVKPTKTANDALQRFQSITATTHQSSVDGIARAGGTPKPNQEFASSYSIVHSAATTIHYLAIIQDWRGQYSQGDQLFRAAIRYRGSDVGLPHHPFSKDGCDMNMEGIYKQLLSAVEKKFGARHPFTATRLEQLGAFYLSGSAGKDMLCPITIERRKAHLQELLRNAIGIRLGVDGAYDPQVLTWDISTVWVNAPPGSGGKLAEFCKRNGYPYHWDDKGGGFCLPSKP